MFDLSLDGGIARLVLSRPEARNAIPLNGWMELARLAAEAEAAGARLLILAGSGSAFCAGADISEFPAFRADAAAPAAFRKAMRVGIDSVRGLAIPTLALIEGPCFGAGVALAIACDIRLAGPAASFAITPAKFGISYPQEDVHRLVSLVGEGQAARLLLGAQPIDGAEAARIGLAERFLPEGAAAEVLALASAIAANDGDSLRTLKQGLRLASTGHARADEQDRRFDELLLSERLASTLSARGRT